MLPEECCTGTQWFLTLGLINLASQLLIVRFVRPECSELQYFVLGLLPTVVLACPTGGSFQNCLLQAV